MYPGAFSKLGESTLASAATISPKTDLVRITGTAEIANIKVPATGGFSTVMFVIPVGVFTWVATGNIGLAGTAVVGRTLVFTFSKSQRKWYPSYVS